MAGRRAFGAVRQLPSGRWQARYRTPKGELLAAPSTFARHRDAEKWLSGLESDLLRGTWIDDRLGRVTVDEWSRTWLRELPNLKPKTRVGYESLARSVVGPHLGGRQLGELSRPLVQGWVSVLAASGMSPSRIRQAYRLLAQMMSSAEMDGVLAVTPCRGIRLPRIAEHEPHVLSPDQVASLVAAIRPPYDLFVLVLAYTGLRFGEAAGLRRRFVDPSTHRLIVASSLSEAAGVVTMEEPKSHQHRVVTMPAFLSTLLAEHIEQSADWTGEELLVFLSPHGLPVRHSNFLHRIWAPAVKAVGLDVRPHDLRASHATWLYDAGWSPVEIAARLGHAKATITTKHYARRVVGRDVEIAVGLDAVYARSAASGTDVARGVSSDRAEQRAGRKYGL